MLVTLNVRKGKCCREIVYWIDAMRALRMICLVVFFHLTLAVSHGDESYQIRHHAHRPNPRAKLNAAESRTLTKENKQAMQLVKSTGEIDLYDENDFEDIDVPPRHRTSRSDHVDTYDTTIYDSEFFDYQYPFHGGLDTLLIRLFEALRNDSARDDRDVLKESNSIGKANTGDDEDRCQRWLDNRERIERAFPGSVIELPACPCRYPNNIFYQDMIWDRKQRANFRWRDASQDSQRLKIYKRGAVYCVRSLPAQGGEGAAAQHCCYDENRRLLTRGSGAGTPYIVSPDMSPVLHDKIDLLPWRLCKGDFTRYNKARVPNNSNNCEINPDDEEYQRQVENAKNY